MQLSLLLCLVQFVTGGESIPQTDSSVTAHIIITVTNAFELERASQCLKERFESRRLATRPLTPPFKTWAEPKEVTKVFETIQKIGNGSLYTCNDGIPRYRFHNSPTAEITNLVTVTSLFKGQLADANWTYNYGCRISADAKFCTSLWDSYKSMAAVDDFDLVDNSQFVVGTDHDEWWGCPDPGQCLTDVGEEVILIYWPDFPSSGEVCPSNNTQLPTIAPAKDDLPKTAILSAITFKGEDLYERATISNGSTYSPRDDRTYIRASVLTGPFTFISPTVYLAHHAITVATASSDQNGEYVAHQTIARSAGVFPLRAVDIYSMRPTGVDVNRPTDFAQQVASGQDDWERISPWITINPNEAFRTYEEAVSFDFNNLRDPVPASVYYDARRDDCWGKQSHCGTITDDSYRPRLAIKGRVWSSLLPDWAACGHGILVDPPIALVALTAPQQQATITAKPRVPARETTFVQGSLSLPPNANPGGTIGAQGATFTQPTAAVRTGHGFHGKPGIFEELVPVTKGRHDGKPSVTPNLFRVDQDRSRGHNVKPEVAGQAQDRGGDPEALEKSGRSRGTTNAVIGHKRPDSVLPALFSSRAHSVDMSLVAGALAVLVELNLYL